MKLVFGKISFESVAEKCTLCKHRTLLTNRCKLFSCDCINTKSADMFSFNPDIEDRVDPNWLDKLYQTGT